MSDRITFAATVTSEGRNIRGSVTLKGARTFRNGEWLEVDPRALARADASDVVGLWDHDRSKVLGRTTNGTVTLNRTEDGIDFEILNLPNTTAANDALELVNGGYVKGSSFQIDGLRSKFSTDPDGLRVRRIVSIKRLVDVSPTPDPAFANSTAAAFSKETAMDETTAPVTVEAPASPPAEPPKSGKAEWESFAATMTTEGIEAALKTIFSETNGDLSGDQLDRYEGFAAELQARKARESATRTRIEAIKFRHDAMVGNLRKAPEAGLFASEEYGHAFGNYLRSGDPSGMEQFAQSIAGDGTQGGYGVPDGFRAIIIDTMKAYGGVQSVSDSITTDSGQPLRWPTNDDTANSAVIAAEGSAAGSGGADLVFGSVTLGAYSYDATGASNLPLLVSKELLQDWAVGDLEAYIARKLGERIGRKLAADFATANGSSKPLGLFAKTPDVMSATTAYAAFVEHFFQVDQAYRDQNASWLMSDTVLTKIFSSLDDNGRPLFTPQAAAGGQGAPAGTILGRPVRLDQGAGELVAFGDFRSGYIIRYVRSVQIDVDPYTNIKSRQIAYHAWARADANVQDAAAYSVSDYTSVSADS